MSEDMCPPKKNVALYTRFAYFFFIAKCINMLAKMSFLSFHTSWFHAKLNALYKMHDETLPIKDEHCHWIYILLIYFACQRVIMSNVIVISNIKAIYWQVWYEWLRITLINQLH